MAVCPHKGLDLPIIHLELSICKMVYCTVSLKVTATTVKVLLDSLSQCKMSLSLRSDSTPSNSVEQPALKNILSNSAPISSAKNIRKGLY